jgi:hypothetical protein
MIYAYIRLSDLEYPFFEGELRIEFPSITEDQTNHTFPCPEGYAPVLDTQPTIDLHDPLMGYEEAAPKNINGVWKKQWRYYELDAEERFARAKDRQRIADYALYNEWAHTTQMALLDTPNKEYLKQYADDLKTWLDEYPRVREKPVMTRNAQTLNNSGSTPDVIG